MDQPEPPRAEDRGVPACPAGDGQEGVRDTGHKHDPAGASQPYRLHECRTCGIQFWTPLEADASIYAGEGYEAYVDYHAGTRQFPRWAEPLFKDLDLPAGGTSLDIGCGDGAVVARLGTAGLDAHGIDLDERSIAAARDVHGQRKVYAATLEEFAERCTSTGQAFDLITFFEVLEHQDDPSGFLDRVRSLGVPGALVVGSVPNRDRFLARLERKLGTGDLPPHHFLWFSADALRALLLRRGFGEVDVQLAGARSTRDIRQRIMLLARRRSAKTGKLVRHAIRAGAWLLAWAVAPPLGWGLSRRPSHLFFRCRVDSPTRAVE